MSTSAPALGPAGGPGSFEFCGLRLAHRVINGSGTFDAIAARRAFGAALEQDFPFAAYVSKTITLQPRAGNPPPRLWEAAGGLINSIGLPNKGLDGYLAEDLPQLGAFHARVPGEPDERMPVPLITNVMGSTAEELAALVDACQRRDEIAAIELNVSCPNVKTGLDIGADPTLLEHVVTACRARTQKPLIVKLTPNTADVAACALAAEAGGADAVSLINTLRAMALEPAGGARAHGSAGGRGGVAPGARRPWLGGGTGGLSGPAIRNVALAQVAAVAARVSVPVVGMGGVQSAEHARELLEVGATLVAVGTESFRDPTVGAKVARALKD
ncbi:MAG TPA: HisA/HisF-related TIM barrel protein [Solirubrobacteraceae bacterium]|nr:HisA/HisF-related TIM barrel protein [Solirubrobacteraceae bacterium]